MSEIKVSYQPTYKELLEALGAVPKIEYDELLKKKEKYAIVVEQFTIKNSCLKCLVERLKEQKQKVIALIKDGRFVEALQLLEKEK